MTDDDRKPIEKAQAALHEAIQEHMAEGEVAIHWCVVIDVAGQDGVRYLQHRSGGGHDGIESPTMWDALGMLKGSAAVAESELVSRTVDPRHYHQRRDDIPDEEVDDDD